jgi:drug/metabolite transporter (DMT)-like permease
MLLVGFGVAVGGYFISQAYRVAEAAIVAPFEYLALPLSVVWGVIVFDEWPDAVSYIGMALIFGAGLFIIWREAAVAKAPLQNPRVRR